jgi:hypothetical protein
MPLADDDPNKGLEAPHFNSSDDDTFDNLDFALAERGLPRNDEATFLPGSQENHGQVGDTNEPRAGSEGE